MTSARTSHPVRREKGNLPTAADLCRPISMNCAECGQSGTAYPYPEGRGTFCCPKCSPFWLEPFVKQVSQWMLERLEGAL